jgi:phosphate transport system substrate-binding protein
MTASRDSARGRPRIELGGRTGTISPLEQGFGYLPFRSPCLPSFLMDRSATPMRTTSNNNHAVLLGAHLQRLSLAACLALAATSVAAGQIRVGGTGSALGTMRLLGDAFAKLGSKLDLQVLPHLGSSGGLRAVQSGAIDIAVISRPPKPEELGAGLMAYEYGRTPFVLVTSKVTPHGLSRSTFADMLSGRITQWPDGTPVRLVLRPASDIDSELVAAMSPQIAEALALARAREGLIVASTDKDAADDAERLPGSLAVNTLALLMSEKRKLNVLALDGVVPSVQALAQGRYPHFKPLYLVTRADATVAVQRFVGFVKSAEGRAILEAHGHLVRH